MTHPPIPDAIKDVSEQTPLQRSQKLPAFKRIKPTLGRVVLKELPTSEMSEGGLYLPQTVAQGGGACRVIWVCDPYESGSGDQDSSSFGPQFEVGDIVLIGKFHGTDIQVGRETYIVCNESDILGILLPE